MRSHSTSTHTIPRTQLLSARQYPFRSNHFTDDLQDIIPAWQLLMNSTRHSDPFYQPLWFDAFAKSFAAGKDGRLFAAYDHSHLAAVLPLRRCSIFFHGVPARTLRSFSNIHSCRFDLICRDDEQQTASTEILTALDLTPDWDVIEAFDVPEDGAFRVLMNTALAQGFLTAEWPTRWCPILQITPESTDPFLNCPSHHKSFRSRLTKKLKKLNDVGEVTFSVDYDLNNHALDRFIALESSGWKGANGSAIGSDSRVRDFYLQAARAAAIDGSLRLYALNLDGTPVAMHFGLFSHGTYFAPKVAYNESFAKFSPGQLLVQHVIRDISVQRATCYDFLGARSEWKSVWASSERAHSNCYIFRNSVRGRLLHALISRVAPTIRRLKYAVYGDPQALKAWAD